MVIWITGMSGSGKSTLASALHDVLKPGNPQTVLLDGDAIRAAFGVGLGYSEPERVTQIKRIQNLAKMLADQGLIVIVAALYAHDDLLQWNRQNLQKYNEVYLIASMSLLIKRDQKSLYSMAQAGETEDVVGIDIPWHPPRSPDFSFNADEELDPAVMVEKLLSGIPFLSDLWAKA
jgi:cytidine diphosphoramidate kinase